jgi:DNA invertase Pin-like site-specific DNA recombinase
VRVLGYVRVSTAKQADEGAGIEVQETRLRTWCMEGDHELVDVHRDEGVSGSLVDRPGLALALADMEAGRAEVLAVYRLDRLARDLVVQETVIERLARAGRQVRSVTEPQIDGADPTRVLIRQVLGAIGQYERALIVARMQAGQAAKAARGGYAYGSPPYGWKAVDHELVIDVDEQATMARVDELRRRKMSLREIAETLVAEGHKPKRGSTWHPEGVRRIVARLEAGFRPLG